MAKNTNTKELDPRVIDLLVIGGDGFAIYETFNNKGFQQALESYPIEIGPIHTNMLPFAALLEAGMMACAVYFLFKPNG